MNTNLLYEVYSVASDDITTSTFSDVLSAKTSLSTFTVSIVDESIEVSMIVGIVIGAVVVAAIIGAVFCFIQKRNKSALKEAGNETFRFFFFFGKNNAQVLQ